jgi:gamma-glutamylcyclotransferase (GGCT)/AIG2-like uncharacterized protein YtfP
VRRTAGRLFVSAVVVVVAAAAAAAAVVVVVVVVVVTETLAALDELETEQARADLFVDQFPGTHAWILARCPLELTSKKVVDDCGLTILLENPW